MIKRYKGPASNMTDARRGRAEERGYYQGKPWALVILTMADGSRAKLLVPVVDGSLQGDKTAEGQALKLLEQLNGQSASRLVVRYAKTIYLKLSDDQTPDFAGLTDDDHDRIDETVVEPAVKGGKGASKRAAATVSGHSRVAGVPIVRPGGHGGGARGPGPGDAVHGVWAEEGLGES